MLLLLVLILMLVRSLTSSDEDENVGTCDCCVESTYALISTKRSEFAVEGGSKYELLPLLILMPPLLLLVTPRTDSVAS